MKYTVQLEVEVDEPLECWNCPYRREESTEYDDDGYTEYYFDVYCSLGFDADECKFKLQI